MGRARGRNDGLNEARERVGHDAVRETAGLDATAPDANAPDAGADSGVNDAMFDLGGDERRMHVRAYNHWVSLLKGRPYPTIADLDPGSIADFGPHSVLLDFSALHAGTVDASGPGGGVDDPRIAYLGAKLREECGLAGPIASIADVPSRSLLSRLTDHYLQIIANRAPIGFEAEFINSRGRTTLYRGILMPFASRGDGIDFLYGVINWKELVDAATQATLAAELDAAVRAAPAPVIPGLPGAFGLPAYTAASLMARPVADRPAATPPGHAPATSAGVPVWADGPSADLPSTPPFPTELFAAEPFAPTDVTLPPEPAVLAHVALESGARPGDMVVLVARVAPAGGLDIIGMVADDAALTEQALRALG